MICEFISRSESKRLIMLFAGWAMDGNIFDGLSHDGYDMLAVWDYNDECLEADLSGYDEICILAWSYGVYFAGRFIEKNKSLPFTAKVAVNGTMCPIDSTYGITPEIFNATIAALSPNSLLKFYRRMCGGAERYCQIAQKLQNRPFESVKSELENIRNTYVADGMPEADWDYAFVSRNDLIYPPQAQLAFWRNKVEIIEIECHHYPDFKRIVSRAFILKGGVVEAFSRSADTYEENAQAQYVVAQTLADKIAGCGRLRGTVWEIGPGSGFLSRRIAEDSGISELTLIDVSPISDNLPGEHVIADAETMIINQASESVDAIVSSSAVQWFNSLKTFFCQAHRVLAPGGLLAVAVYGNRTFNELEGLVSPSIVFTTTALKRYVEPLFDILDIEETAINQKFNSPMEVLRHFRLTGVAPAATSMESVAVAKQVVRNNVTTLTYNPIFLLLTKKKL